MPFANQGYIADIFVFFHFEINSRVLLAVDYNCVVPKTFIDILARNSGHKSTN